MTNRLTVSEAKREILAATARPVSVDTHGLCDRVCRTDAIGRFSVRDQETFDLALAEMVARGEITMVGPFISRGREEG
jgi:hypothetical protein